MTTKFTLHEVFSKNRAEEIGFDVWEHFVVPLFYDKLDLNTARKPRIILGGRGCGKTMLLRYLSHKTMFSLKRDTIPDDALSHIGLYWRADTQFCNLMSKRDQPDDVWESAFNHFAALILSLEIFDSLKSIAASNFQSFNQEDIKSLNFSRLQAFDQDLPEQIDELYSNMVDRLWNFEGWVSDVRKCNAPRFLPGRHFVIALIKVIQSQNMILNKASFFVYLDEYENLCVYQKQIINTWLKHSEVPLIFNLAMKKNAFDIKATVGTESISDIHDYRQHDLEAYLNENFPVFAAEILLLNLSLANVPDFQIDPNDLRDPGRLAIRRQADYCKRVKDAAHKLFPDVSQEDLAKTVMEDSALSAKLSERIQYALSSRKSDLKLEDFLRKKLPEASIVVPALLNRKKLQPAYILHQMELLSNNEKTLFTSWIHNNFIGCLLQLYAPFSKACPFYAGFDTFCKLSRGNIRHFLELCHNSLYKSVREDDEHVECPVVATRQAEAARQASADFLGEVRSFGRLGEQLHTFVLRMGTLFELAQNRSTQSESEVSHFSIRRGVADLTVQDYEFLREATKYSVLYEEKDTKKKSNDQPEAFEYILNPIYAPYFHISYRKKRKLELSSDEAIYLIRGNLNEFTSLIRQYEKKWANELQESNLTLFSLIGENK